MLTVFVKLHHRRLLDSDKPSILKQNYKTRNPLMLQWVSFGDFLQRYSRCGKSLVSSAVLANIARIWCLHVPFCYGQSYYWSTLTEYGIMSGFSEENSSTSSAAPGRITSTSLSRADSLYSPAHGITLFRAPENVKQDPVQHGNPNVTC